MFSRDAVSAIKRLSSQFPVIGITGPRQSGKSTLATMVFKDKKYITFDDKGLRDVAVANPRDFLSAFPDGVIIDEAQKVPEIFEAIKIEVDLGNAKPGKYILTGSSGFKLKENITDSLAGRIGLIKLLPFSLSEIRKNSTLNSDPYYYVFNGFYPPLYDNNKNFKTFDWFSNYIDTYLDLDVRENINNSNLSLFRKFVTLCATYSGKLVNYDAISNDLGISSVTIKSWMSILENSFIITFLEPDLNNLGKSLVKTPKLYFTDTGLLCHLLRIRTREDLMLSPYKGAIVETMAVLELLKCRYNNSLKPDLSFFRDKNGLEVDIIASWNTPFAIEVKSNSLSDKKLSLHLKKYLVLANNPDLKGKVFYFGDFSMRLGDIEYVSWQNWGEIEK